MARSRNSCGYFLGAGTICILSKIQTLHESRGGSASHDDYEDSYLPSGYPVGTCEEALDTACGLYLNDPTAWT